MPSQTFTRSSERVFPKGTSRYVFFRSIEAAGQDWDAAAPVDDIFLQRQYLSIVENNPPIGMQFGYLVFYEGDLPVGVALCQIKTFKADDSIQDLGEKDKSCPCFFQGVSNWLKRRVAGMVNADILICGNMLLTGEHGFWFDPTRINPGKGVELLECALVEILQQMDREGVKMPAILIKDILPMRHEAHKTLTGKGFVEFKIQPNMVLDLPFRTFDDYLGAMTTKYRTRAKRAFKKKDGIEVKQLSYLEIQRELPRIYSLYRDIANNAGFNMIDLNERYLMALKREMSAHFHLFAYYLDGQLIAFYTTVTAGKEMEAHFLGYDKSINHDLQLYLNILYDIIRLGIEAGCEQIVFARTALEIKSSVGAVAVDLSCYLRQQNSIANHFTGTMLDYLKPVEEWLPRHPFREEATPD
jgi:hypothetical protein